MNSILSFNSNEISKKGSTIFGLPFNEKNAELIIVPVPWEVTVSYKRGTSKSIKQIFDASMQVDLLDLEYKDAWKKGIYMQKLNIPLFNKSKELSSLAITQIDALERGVNVFEDKKLKKELSIINTECAKMNEWVYEKVKTLISKNKKTILLGGDHSVTFGSVKALLDAYKNMGILQIDAHCDLRRSYENFTYSHASIMYNVVENLDILKSLTQVGVRDFCDEEFDYINSNKKIKPFFDKDIQYKKIEGIGWNEICDEIIQTLPQNIYLSFDIDGLNPSFCPATGTPVIGGLDINEVYYLLNKVHKSGKKIVGADLVEIGYDSAGDWNGNVGSRILYKLASLLLSC